MITPISLLSQAVDFILRRKKLFIFIVVVFLLIVGISTLCRGGIGSPPRRTDITVFLRAAIAIKSGENIYFVTNERGWYYVYLPFLAIILSPFTSLPLLANTTILYTVSATALCAMVILSARMAEDRQAGMRAAVLALLFCMAPFLESMTRGQLGTLSAFLAIAILYLYMKGWTAWAGILFGFSVVLKSSPLAFLMVLFIVKREWKMVASALAGIFFFAWAYPSFVIGAERNWLFLTEWKYTLTHAASSAGSQSRIWSQLVTPLSAGNQSLYGAITRWFIPSETVLASHGNFRIQWGVRVFGIAALGLLGFVCRRKRSQLSPKRLMLEYSLFPVLMLLLSPVNEMHHFTIFFVLFLPVFLYLNELPRNSASYQCLMWASLIAGVTQILGDVDPFNEWGVPAIGALLFWCVSFVFLATTRREKIW